jgi:hypothetical protein
LQNQFIIQPYQVGKNKRSLAMILPSAVVKALNIDPLAIFLFLKVDGSDDLQLKIIREKDLVKKDTKNTISADKFTRLTQQVSISGS